MFIMHDNSIRVIGDKGRKIGDIELSWHPDLIQNSVENLQRSWHFAFSHSTQQLSFTQIEMFSRISFPLVYFVTSIDALTCCLTNCVLRASERRAAQFALSLLQELHDSSRRCKCDYFPMIHAPLLTRPFPHHPSFCLWRVHQNNRSVGSRELAYRYWACRALIQRSLQRSTSWKTMIWGRVCENKISQKMVDLGIIASFQFINVTGHAWWAWASINNNWHGSIGIKEYSEWPTIPQLYVDKEFIGGCDILMTMHQDGSLAKMLEEKGVLVSEDETSEESPKWEKKSKNLFCPYL